MKLIRDEYVSASKSAETDYQQESLQRILKSEEGSSDWGKNVSDFRERVFEIIEELTHDIDNCSDDISKQAIGHIHANEIILTIGRSRTVERFLKNAAKTRKFEVIVAEAAPDFSGHQMAVNLAKGKISTTVITDSAIFAMMARVNKVIIGTTSILADGTVVAAGGDCEDAVAGEQEEVDAECGDQAPAAVAASAEAGAGGGDVWPGCLPDGEEALHSCPSCQGS